MGLAIGRQTNFSLKSFIGSHKIKIIGYSNVICHDLSQLDIDLH